MNTMLKTDMQRSNELEFARTHVLRYMKTWIEETPEVLERVEHGVILLKTWLGKNHFESKQKRLNQIRDMDLKQLVLDITAGIAFVTKKETFVTVTGQMASHLNFSDRRDSIATIGEMLGVLCNTGIFVIWKQTLESQMMLQSQMSLPAKLLNAIERSQYPTPMVCPPEIVKSNFESGHLTFNDPRILGKHAAHTDDICLDIINTQSQIALKLNTEFLSIVEEEPNPDKPLDTLEKQRNWSQLKASSYETYLLMAKQGNEFYFNPAYDKRGRVYTQGYQINFQGSSFKRASLQLAKEEHVTV